VVSVHGAWPAMRRLRCDSHAERGRQPRDALLFFRPLPSPFWDRDGDGDGAGKLSARASLMSCAPAFSTGSSSSMARAIDTPSLMTCGTPYDCSSTTLRPAARAGVSPTLTCVGAAAGLRAHGSSDPAHPWPPHTETLTLRAPRHSCSKQKCSMLSTRTRTRMSVPGAWQLRCRRRRHSVPAVRLQQGRARQPRSAQLSHAADLAKGARDAAVARALVTPPRATPLWGLL